MKRFIIQFKELYNNQALHTVEILNTGSVNGTVYLMGAKTPFEWEEDDSDNLLDFPRRKTGKISIVVTPDTDISDLLPTSTTSHLVELDGVHIGWLEPMVFNIPMFETEYNLKLNVVSYIGLAAGEKFNTLGAVRYYTRGEVVELAVGGAYYIMPTGIIDGGVREFSGLLINPYYKERDFHFTNINDIYDRPYTYDILNELCKYYHYVVHEVVYNGEICYVFCDFRHDGKYVLFDIDEQESSELAITGATEEDFYNRFTIAGNDASIKLIRPQKLIKLLSNYEDIMKTEFDFALSQYMGKVEEQGQSIYFLNPIDRQIESAFLFTDPATYDRNARAVIVCGMSDEDGDVNECIYVKKAQDNVKLMTIIMNGCDHPNRLMMKFKDISADFNMQYSIECNGKYWDHENMSVWSTTEVKYNALINESNKDFVVPFSFYYDDTNGGRPIRINIYTTTSLYVLNFKIMSIVIEGSAFAGIPNKYNQDLSKELTINGPIGAESETELSCIFGINKYTVNNLSYMFDIQRRITITVVRQDITYADYIKKWTFGNDPLKYRLIGVEDSPRDSLMTLTFIGCETIS